MCQKKTSPQNRENKMVEEEVDMEYISPWTHQEYTFRHRGAPRTHFFYSRNLLFEAIGNKRIVIYHNESFICSIKKISGGELNSTINLRNSTIGSWEMFKNYFACTLISLCCV